METWKNDPNKRALAIVRRSGVGQKDNTSANTQERDIRAYVKIHGLDLIKIESIIETAFIAEDRKKYQALMQFALSQGIKHIIFYVGSREARNSTDNENNEKLIRDDKIIVHHVSEGKVFWKGSPDADFLQRDLIAAINKNYSRENGTKMRAAFRTKAENGWWPYNHTPLGYVHSKDKDANGNPIKGTAKLTRDFNAAKVKLVQEEFRLRAQGFSYDEIRKRNVEGGLVPFDFIKKYSRHAIEERLKTPLYWGFFYLCGDPKRYQGKHELIIPENVLRAVKAINDGHGCKVRKMVAGGEDLFRGWLTCAHPECQRQITYERKEKELKSTGGTKVYHLYRCSNSRKVHAKKQYVGEDKIWKQFEPAVEALTISQEFANDITAALNETHEKQKVAIKKQMDGYNIKRVEIREMRSKATDLRVRGEMNATDYGSYIADLDKQEDHYASEIERLTLTISDEAMVSVKKVFELAINAKELYKSMDRGDRLEYLKKVCSNPTLDGLTLQFQLQSPFARLSNWKENSNWRREVVDFRTDCVAWAA